MVTVIASVSGNQAMISVTYGAGDSGLPQGWLVVIDSKQDHGAGLDNLNYDYTYYVLQHEGTGTQSFAITLASGDYLATLILDDGSKPDYAVFSVGAAPGAQILSKINITPSSSVLKIGDIQGMTASCLDQNNKLMSCPATPVWSIDNPAVGNITPTGQFTAISIGTTVVRATSGGITGLTIITVASPACVSNWACIRPPNGYETDGCGNIRANVRCTPPPQAPSLGTTLLVLAGIAVGLVALGIAAGRK